MRGTRALVMSLTVVVVVTVVVEGRSRVVAVCVT